jgi:predicted RNase H-like HicB family nuclease
MSASPSPQQSHEHIEHYGEHTIVYEQGPTSWGAYVEDLPTCFAVGDTFEECERLIKEGLVIHLTGLLAQATARSGSAAS